MKTLAETISNIYESQFTIKELNVLKNNKNAKNVFEIINMGWNIGDKIYSNKSCQIMDSIKEHSFGFVIDIATKFENVTNHFQMSQKQMWCLAFAFIKIENELTKI